MIKTDLVNYYFPEHVKDELKKINGIDFVIPSFDKSLNITIDLWFNEDWNIEIKPILLHLKSIRNFKIYSLKITFKIKNIHINLQPKKN